MISGSNIIYFIIALIVVCVFIYRNNKRKDEEKCIHKLKTEFGQVPTKQMSAERYANVPAYDVRHRTDHSVDDITWNDLELTALYHRIDSTQSAAGEEYLYHVLRTPAQDAAEAAALVDAQALTWFGDAANIAQRIRLQRILRQLGHTGRYSLYEYLDQLDTLGVRSNGNNILCCILPFAAIGIMFANVQAGIVILLAVIAYNMVTYYREKGQIEPYIVSFRYILRLLDAASAMAEENCEALVADNAVLREIAARYAGFRHGSSIVMSHSEMGSGNAVDLVLDYVRIVFHLDLIKFNTMLRTVQAGRADIDRLLQILGRIDAEIAIASFRASLQNTCTPAFVDGSCGVSLQITDLVHPMLEHAVPNSIDAHTSILLTGSNASGKSTFLKAAAIAALLAQTVGFVPATHYQAPRYRLYSSMALRDSMQDGDSYYMVEIKSLKRIVDASAAAGNPVLCCIDEVLRGTNTVERIAASSEILQYITDTGHVLCIAATHDLELAELLTGYHNVHFAETLVGDDVTFTYQLREGRATTRNAIRLLRQVGFDADITAKAEARAERFDSTGIWE